MAPLHTAGEGGLSPWCQAVRQRPASEDPVLLCGGQSQLEGWAPA